jgi:hypothetical protein
MMILNAPLINLDVAIMFLAEFADTPAKAGALSLSSPQNDDRLAT